MAKLYVTEFGAYTADGVPIAKTNIIVDQIPLAIGGASVQSVPFSAGTRYVRIHTDAICSIVFGTNPVSTTNNARMAANQTEYFSVNAGDRVAVIANV